ncbi:MAG: substrate-binding domain-containing protein [Cyclobacteriaceae bacterium]|nr:substrate-binding domain-containing protein [Cyclobacteriaceae bacterium]
MPHLPFSNARVDGLLVALSHETNNFEHLQELVNEDIPIVFLDRMCEEIDAPYVMTDDFEGAKMATEYMIERGSSNIAFMQGPENISTTFSRFMGYKEALKKNGMRINQTS